jgi:universal stress protein A
MKDTYTNILLATELTDASRHTAEIARKLANGFNAMLSIIHVVEFVPLYGISLNIPDVNEQLLESGKERLHAFGQDYDVSPEHQYLCAGSPQETILKQADKLNCDLIVIGSHDKSWFSPLLGSTANAIMAQAKCDVFKVNLRDKLRAAEKSK